MKNELFKAIKGYERWVCWRSDGLNQDGTFHRDFYIPVVGARIPATEENQDRLADFHQAIKVIRSDMYFDGIAFALADNLPYVCITVANCIEPSTGKLNETAAAILDKIYSTGGYRVDKIRNIYQSQIKRTDGTYIELLDEETGISIWGLGEMPAGKESIIPGVTIQKNGYIPITRHAIDNFPLRDLQAVIDSLTGCTEDKQAEPSTRENETEPGRKAGEIS